ncbi:hypothetical protein Ancab_003936 [Ancistrocladus abbreviatus]
MHKELKEASPEALMVPSQSKLSAISWHPPAGRHSGRTRSWNWLQEITFVTNLALDFLLARCITIAPIKSEICRT